MTNRFKISDEVRADIPDETDPNHETYYGRRSEIVEILSDNAGLETGDR